MITNFEGLTGGLSDDEMWLIPTLVKCFKQVDHKSKAIKGPEIIRKINEWTKKQGSKASLSEPRLRKCCNYIRSNSLIPLIATSKGYYCSYDPVEIQSQIRSLQERSDAILNCVNGMKKFL